VTSAEERIELVRRGNAAWEAGDLAGTLELLDPEIVTFAPRDVANAGTFHGHEGFLQWAAAWSEAWDEFRQDLVEITPIGERHVIAEVHQNARGRASGLELEQRAWYVYEVRDSRAVYLAVYLDRDAAFQDAREREGET
jgi:ketosteroid isomerase-like protein